MISLPLVETVVSVITSVMGRGGLLAQFLLMIVASFGIPPLPSEIILPFAGFLIFSGDYGWAGALVAASRARSSARTSRTRSAGGGGISSSGRAGSSDSTPSTCARSMDGSSATARGP